MHIRTTGSLLISLVSSVLLGLAVSATVLAQSSEDALAPIDEVQTPVVIDQASEAPGTLFLRIADPTDEDTGVSLATTNFTIRGLTLPNAVVSLDGDLTDVDESGQFAAVAALEEGANAITIIASNGEGQQITTTLYVVRGD